MSLLILKTKSKNLPGSPGVYLMKNEQAQVIYVGKAKNLKNRVGSYFTGQKDLKTQRLMQDIYDFDIMLTKTEAEALLLERTLIKHNAPKYNVVFKDGKEYPFLRIDFKQDWPRIEKVRRRKQDGASYIGPFSNAGNLTTALSLAGKVFPKIRCSKHEFKAAKRPCNYYHMKMCLAPCSLPVDREQYLESVRGILAIVMGKNKELLRDLKSKMFLASDNQKYETAAAYRDQITALEGLYKKQHVVSKSTVEADIFAVELDKKHDHAAIHILMLRNHCVIGSENFLIETPTKDKNEILRSFLLQYFEDRIPSELLLLPSLPDDHETLSQCLGPGELDSPCKMHVPMKGEKHELLLMAEKNARYHLDENERKVKNQKTELKSLQETLKLPNLPVRMECMDISNLGASQMVASSVCFLNGKPAKDEYRIYHIKESEGQNDFASLFEAVTRRIKHDPLPDLLVIDGGKGQLNAAVTAMKKENVVFPIISLAKARKTKSLKYERVFFPGDPDGMPLKPGSSEFRLLTHIRDEAHRFALHHHRKKRSKESLKSVLDEIKGVGNVLKARLLSKFGSIEGIKNASFEQLTQVKGVHEDLATRIHARLKS